jgi:uncharacterized protein
MELTAAEYATVRAAYFSLISGQEVARVILPSGKRIDYHPKDIKYLAALVSGYEMANGTAAVRTYARNVRRR